MLSGLGAQPNQEVKKYTAQRNLSWLYHFPQSPESHHIDDCHDCQREVILQKTLHWDLHITPQKISRTPYKL